MTSRNNLNHKDNKNEVVREFTLKLHATIEEVNPTVDTSPNRYIIRPQLFDPSQIPAGYEVVSGEKFGGPDVPLLLPTNFQLPDGWEMAFRRIYEDDPEGTIVIFVGKPNPSYYRTRYMIEDSDGKMHGVGFSEAKDFDSAVKHRNEELEYIAARFTNDSTAAMERSLYFNKLLREKAIDNKDIKLGHAIDSKLAYQASREKRRLRVGRGGSNPELTDAQCKEFGSIAIKHHCDWVKAKQDYRKTPVRLRHPDIIVRAYPNLPIDLVEMIEVNKPSNLALLHAAKEFRDNNGQALIEDSSLRALWDYFNRSGMSFKQTERNAATQ